MICTGRCATTGPNHPIIDSMVFAYGSRKSSVYSIHNGAKEGVYYEQNLQKIKGEACMV